MLFLQSVLFLNVFVLIFLNETHLLKFISNEYTKVNNYRNKFESVSMWTMAKSSHLAGKLSV